METQFDPSQSSHHSTLLGEEHKEERLQEGEGEGGGEAMDMALASSSRHIPYMRSSLKYKMQACIDNSIQVAGPLLIALALTLISCVIYLFFTTILPSMYNIYSLGGIIHTLIAAWLIFNVLFNYYYCIKTDPGSPPESPDLLLHFNVHGRSSEYAGEAILGRWCKRCQKPKPPMTHHCHICKRCILKMDHHCPWMNNCIGFYNYRFFFLFLFYMWIGCGYTVYMASIPLKTIGDDDFENGVLFTFLMALAVFISLTGLFWFHAYLISTAQTTIDFYAYRRQRREARREARAKGVRFIAPRYVNEYDLGRLRNVKALFDRGGSYWWLLMFLPSSLPPKGNGLSFVKRNEMIQEGGPSLNGIPDPLRRRDGESNWPGEEFV